MPLSSLPGGQVRNDSTPGQGAGPQKTFSLWVSSSHVPKL